VPVKSTNLHQFGAVKKYKMVRFSLESGPGSDFALACLSMRAIWRARARARVYP
jgi:hypothetical protein